MANTGNPFLIDAAASVLVVIDIQDSFLKKLDPQKAQSLVDRAVWLISVAKHLDVPVVAVAEDMEKTGPLTAPVQNALPDDTTVHNKNAFGVAGNPPILSGISATGRKTAVCIGLETDVCVAQSALGLIAEGYRVAVPQDVVGSPDWDQQVGFDRMRDSGVVITSAKALYYEWLRTISAYKELDAKAPELVRDCPADLVL